MSDFAESARDLWWSPLGSGALTFLLTAPRTCEFDSVTTKLDCQNYLGFSSFLYDSTDAAILAVLAGVLVWAVASAVAQFLGHD